MRMESASWLTDATALDVQSAPGGRREAKTSKRAPQDTMRGPWLLGNACSRPVPVLKSFLLGSLRPLTINQCLLGWVLE